MAEAAQHAQHEFWRPPIMQAATDPAGLTDTDPVEACDRCGTEFIVGSRFCHSCGTGRAGVVPTSRLREKITLAQFASLAEGLGLSIAAFIAFVAGIACLLAAAAVGVVFSTQRVIDWQAVQLWRIEWLLGAVAAFVAGCLLKRTR
jgi:ribosomal protein L37E